MSKVRDYRFTLNNYTPEEEQQLKELAGVKYLVFGHEICPTTGTPHLQGYVYFKNAKHFNALKKINQRISWRTCDASPEDNRDYCLKEDTSNYFETGLCPVSQKRKGERGGEAEAERWKDARVAAEEGRLEDIPDDIYIRYYRTLKEIKKDHMIKPSDLDNIENYWIWGKPGCGKSRSARERFPDFYPKMMNKWWDGYQGEENILLDDFELDGKVLGHHLKIWGDRYAFVAENKGGAISIRPKRIIITSNYSPDMVFGEDQEMLAAVLRRFNVECMSEYPAMTFLRI
jgi:Putative viral replication protein/RNA helicase